MTVIEVKLKLSEDVLKTLQRESMQRNVPFDEVVSDILADYFDEPSHEELLAGLKRSLEQVLAGEYRPAREFLDEIDDETGNNANNS